MSGTDDRPAGNDRSQPFVLALPDRSEHFALLGPCDGAGLYSGLVTLQPGENCGWHSTENHEELIICLAGEGFVKAGGTGWRLAAGRYAYNPPHTRHNVLNTGTEPMRYIYVVAPVHGETGGGSACGKK